MARAYRITWLVVLLAALLLAVGWWLRSTAERGIWQFNFAPAGAYAVPGFLQVDAADQYTPWRGYGWLDAIGEGLSGSWPGAGTAAPEWESRGALTLIKRRSPDELAATFATAGARFAVDLPPGQYEIWVLSGDAGYREYTPAEPYRVMVQGEEAYRFDLAPADYRGLLEGDGITDYLDSEGVWRQSIAPRFIWSRSVVDIGESPLQVWVEAPRLANPGLHLAGNYPYTEAGRGPASRHGGALNALVVVPVDDDPARGERAIAHIDRWRRERIDEKWPVATESSTTFQCQDGVDYHSTFVDPMAVLAPQGQVHGLGETLQLRATPGETISLSLVVSPCETLGATRLLFSDLLGDAGNADFEAAVSGGVVLYSPIASGVANAWQPRGKTIWPSWEWPIGAGINRQFWINYRVPDTLPAGTYRTRIEIQPHNGQRRFQTLQLEVLPFRLQRPEQLVLGMTYFSPLQDGRFGEEEFWRRLEAEFRDMRRQGLNTVQFTGIGIDDYERLDRVMAIYRDTGFSKPLILLESYGAMDRLRRDGIAWGTEAFYDAYTTAIARLLEQGRQRAWPPFVINFGDEFTNSGEEAFGEEVARRLRRIPGIVISADSNGYKELTLLAPHVDIIAFNNGWEGKHNVNGSRTLLNPQTVAEVEAAGAEPWFVNVGTDRFSNGFWLWRMARLGVKGKLEWMYRGYNGLPHDPFDGVPLKTPLVVPGEDGSVAHTLAYEQMRLGLDDLAWLYTLEVALAAAIDAGNAPTTAIEQGQALLEELELAMETDFNHYLEPGNRWPDARFDLLRQRIIDAVVALQPAAQKTSG